MDTDKDKSTKDVILRASFPRTRYKGQKCYQSIVLGAKGDENVRRTERKQGGLQGTGFITNAQKLTLKKCFLEQKLTFNF